MLVAAWCIIEFSLVSSRARQAALRSTRAILRTQVACGAINGLIAAIGTIIVTSRPECNYKPISSGALLAMACWKRDIFTQNEAISHKTRRFGFCPTSSRPGKKRAFLSSLPKEPIEWGRLVGYFTTKRPVAGQKPCQKRRTIRPQVRPIAGPPSGHCLAGCGHSAVRSREQKRPPSSQSGQNSQNGRWPLVCFAHCAEAQVWR